MCFWPSFVRTVRAKCPNHPRVCRLQGSVAGLGEDGDFRVAVIVVPICLGGCRDGFLEIFI